MNRIGGQQLLWRPSEEVLHFLATECRPSEQDQQQQQQQQAFTSQPSDEGKQRVQKHQLLWRPSGEVLHFLTECGRPPQELKEAEAPIPVAPVEPPKARQVPSVWRPPSAMKAIVHPPCPEGSMEEACAAKSNTDEFSDDHGKSSGSGADQTGSSSKMISEEPLVSSMLPMSGNDGTKQEQLERQTSISELSCLRPPSQSHFSSSPAVTAAAPLVSSDMPRSSSLSCGGAEMRATRASTGIISPFIPQQAVAKTPLFSGLGTVRFSSASISAPQSSSIFTQSPGFGATMSQPLFQQQQPQQQQQHPQQHQLLQQQQHDNIRWSSTNSTSEKDSSNSQAGDAPSLASFRPSELQGKSLLSSDSGANECSPVKGSRSSRGASNNNNEATKASRKTRTKPLEAVMGRAKTREQSGNGTESMPAVAKHTGELPPVIPKRKKQQQLEQKQQQQEQQQQPQQLHQHDAGKQQQQQQQQQQPQQEQHCKAYFAHTGAWIVQKKCLRRATSKFENVAINGTRVAGKKRSLTAMSNEKAAAPKATEKRKSERIQAIERKVESRTSPDNNRKQLLKRQQQQADQKMSGQQPRPSLSEKRKPDKSLSRSLRGQQQVKKPKTMSIQQQETRSDRAQHQHQHQHQHQQQQQQHQQQQQQQHQKQHRQAAEKKRKQKLMSSNKEKGGRDEEEEEDEDGEQSTEDDEETEDELEQRLAEPLIRSKRGRNQALPTRLRDSVLNKVKKRSRK